MAKSVWQQKAEEAELKLKRYKDRVKEQVERCQEDYGLDLCEDGLGDFFGALDIEWSPKQDFSLTLRINGIRMETEEATRWEPGNVRPAGWDVLQQDLENKLDAIMRSLLEEHLDDENIQYYVEYLSD